MRRIVPKKKNVTLLAWLHPQTPHSLHEKPYSPLEIIGLSTSNDKSHFAFKETLSMVNFYSNRCGETGC